MKKFLLVVTLLFVVITLGQNLYIYQGFSYLTGSITAGDNLEVIVPEGGFAEPSSFMLDNVPEGTNISYVMPVSLNDLYEDYIGKRIEFIFENGSRENVTVLATTPVLKDQIGNLYFNPKGTPVFPGAQYNSDSIFKIMFPGQSHNEKMNFSYRLRNNNWTTLYKLQTGDDQYYMTGLMSVDLSMKPDDLDIYLVASNPSAGVAVRNIMIKEAAMDYASSPETSNADVRIYKIDTPLMKGYNAVAFLSKELKGSKSYVFRPNYYTGSFSGVDIDILLPEIPVDVPAGSIEIWDGDHLAGNAMIGNTPAGESLNLKGIARSIELTGMMSSQQTSSDSRYWYYTNHYSLKNLSKNDEEIILEELLPGGADKIRMEIKGEEINIDIADLEGKPLTYPVKVDSNETVKITIEYRVRK